MSDAQNNLTLEQINYEDNDIDSLSAISQIVYEQEYSHLNDFSLNQDHLQLSKINLSPTINKYHINFYENQHSLAKNAHQKDKKIATMTFHGKNTLRQPIKLPDKQSHLYLQVASRQHQTLRGQLLKNNGNSSVKLFNTQGKQKGNFSYFLEKKHKREEEIAPTLQLAEDNTLQSKDFIDEMQSIKRQLIDKDKISLQSRATLKTQTEQPMVKKKYVQAYQHKQVSDQDNEDSSSVKSQIDYMGYQPNQQIEKKVAEYRFPLSSKAPYKLPNKAIDYHSIKKSMRKLGISNNHKIQKMLDKRIPHKYDQIQSLPQQKVPVVHKLPPSFHQDFSSQAQQIKPELISFGVGTYTPIPSRQFQERQEVSKPQEFPAKLIREQSSNSIKGQQPLITKSKDYPNQNQNGIKTAKRYQHRQSALSHQKYLKRSQEDYSNQLQQQSSQQRSIIKNIGQSFEKKHQLSLKNKVYQIKLGQNRLSQRMRDPRIQSQQSHKNQQRNSRQFQTFNRFELLSQSQNQSALFPEFDLCINNISVNFHKHSFGAKYLELSINPTTYKTEEQSGNNLIWIGKNFLFRRVTGNNELNLILKKISSQNMEQILGEVKIKVSDIVINIKKSYFQTFLLNKKSVLAIVIVGFQIINKSYLLKKNAFPLKIARQSHAQTELSKSKTTKIKRKSPKKRQGQKHYTKAQQLPQARVNPIRMRKYLGGKNIKIGKASRFANQCLEKPGPTDYYIESQFSRHAQKDY